MPRASKNEGKLSSFFKYETGSRRRKENSGEGLGGTREQTGLLKQSRKVLKLESPKPAGLEFLRSSFSGQDTEDDLEKIGSEENDLEVNALKYKNFAHINQEDGHDEMSFSERKANKDLDIIDEYRYDPNFQVISNQFMNELTLDATKSTEVKTLKHHQNTKYVSKSFTKEDTGKAGDEDKLPEPVGIDEKMSFLDRKTKNDFDIIVDSKKDLKGMMILGNELQLDTTKPIGVNTDNNIATEELYPESHQENDDYKPKPFNKDIANDISEENQTLYNKDVERLNLPISQSWSLSSLRRSMRRIRRSIVSRLSFDGSSRLSTLSSLSATSTMSSFPSISEFSSVSGFSSISYQSSISFSSFSSSSQLSVNSLPDLDTTAEGAVNPSQPDLPEIKRQFIY